MRKLFLVVIYSLLSFTSITYCYAASCPELNGFLVDACGDGGYEGFNEMLVFKTGAYAYDLNELTIAWSALSGGGGGNLYETTNGFCIQGDASCPAPVVSQLATSGANVNNGFSTNPDRVNFFNLIAGCAEGNLLFSPTSNIIPADATVIVFSGGVCWPEPFAGSYYPYNFDSYCGQGPIYVIFKNDCVGQGKFTNSNDTDRTVELSFGTVSDGCNTTVSCDDYTVNYIPNSGGDGVGFEVSGTETTTGILVDIDCNTGFIQPSGQACDQTPPEIGNTEFCVGENPVTIPVTTIGNGVTLNWYTNAAGTGTPFATSTTASPDITYSDGTFTNTTIYVQSADTDCAGPSCIVPVDITYLYQLP